MPSKGAPAPCATSFLRKSVPPTHLRLCADWLLDFLTAAGEPVKPRDVVQAAHQAGFPRRTLYRARRTLRGRLVQVGTGPHDPAWGWSVIDSGKKDFRR